MPRASLDTYERAMRILTIRDHGSQELRRKLRQKGCPKEEIDGAIERLQTAGYLDDGALAAREVERLTACGFGPRAVRKRLAARAFPADAVNAAIRHTEQDGRFLAACTAALQKRFRPPPGRWERKAWLKAARFLAGRGFPEQLVCSALRAYEPDEDDG